MVLDYRGVNIATEELAQLIYDPDHEIYGNWPRAIQAAYSVGVPGYLTRFSDWSQVEASIAAAQPLVVAVRAEEGELEGAPYESTSGHLLVIVGFDETGRVEVNDPAASDASKGQTTYSRADLERVWLQRGGTAYVLLPREEK